MDDELSGFVKTVARRHRSAMNYAECSNDELIAYLVLMESCARRCVIAFSDAPERPLREVYDQAAAIAYNLGRSDLEYLRRCGADWDVVAFLVRVRCDL